jgi:hypothetical protein
VPLFPLERVWLFPSVVLPLHIFEPRYRQMIEDSLDGPGRLVLGTIRSEHEGELAACPPIYPVAGLGEIGRHERLPDGRFNILLVGLQRVFVQEAPSDRLYRRVAIHPAPEVPVAAEKEPLLRSELLAALGARTADLPEIPPSFALSHLVDMLVLRMPLPPEVVSRFYQELDVERRARAALAEHEHRPELGG